MIYAVQAAGWFALSAFMWFVVLDEGWLGLYPEMLVVAIVVLIGNYIG